jgi:DNA-directed RNA polymerase subunit RPC12/RpoP
MYKCLKCGRPLQPEKERAYLSSDWREIKCTCGSRVFMKARPERVKRVKAR